MSTITEGEVARRREALERTIGAWTPRSLATAFDAAAVASAEELPMTTTGKVQKYLLAQSVAV